MKFGMTNGWGENSRTFAPKANINTLITVNTVVPGTTIADRLPVPGRRLQHADHGHPERQQRLRQLRAGHVDDEAADAELRRALRALQRVGPGGIVAGVHLDRARATSRRFPNVPNWNDWAVRFAAAYDLSGDGKTAIKANAGKYVASQAAGFAQTFNGMNGATQTRTWNDAERRQTILTRTATSRSTRSIGGTSNFGQITARPDPNLDPRLQLGVQRAAAARVAAAHVGHGRLLSPRLLQPAGHRQPEPGHDGLDARYRSRRRPTRVCRSPASRSRCTR